MGEEDSCQIEQEEKELRGLENAKHNKHLQRTAVSVSLIDNLPHDAVVTRPLKRGVRLLSVMNQWNVK